MAGLSKKKLYLVSGVMVSTFVPTLAHAETSTSSKSVKHYKVEKKAVASARPAHTAPTSVHASNAEVVHVAVHRTNSVFNTSTPQHSTTQVTVVTGAELLKTGQSNVLSALAQANPAITTAALPGGGASSFVQTMQLRGQSPDDTLILINGHRRHIGANFNSNSGTNWGSEPADISLIPVSAIDHIEVITEGASALYGQDAIAGAVNIVLKKDTHGGSVNFKNSGFYAGDGQALDGSANYGMAIGNKGGYLDLAAQVAHQMPTTRGGDFYGTLFSDSRNETANRNVQRGLGIPKSTLETLSENMAVPFGQGFEFYSTSTFSHRRANVAETYRSAAATDSWINPTLYPNGNQPYITMDQYDFQTDNGIRTHKFGFAWDAYVTYGRDQQKYGTKDSENVSIPGSTQTSFYDGSSIASELTAGLRGSRSFRTSLLPREINLRFGAEYRHDTFQMTEGEPASWEGLGATDHPGNVPLAVTDQNRDVYEGNVNLDFHITKKWEWTLGGRAASYNNLATVETGSIGTRYDFNKRWAIRANINTGYRPPTLGEMSYFYSAPYPGYTVDQIPANSAIAKYLGAGKMKGEYSRSYSIGLDASPIDNFHITGNLYYIAINGRLGSTKSYSVDTSDTTLMNLLSAASLTSATTLSYYANLYNTQTFGGDLNANYTLHTNRYGKFVFSMGINFSDNEIRSAKDNLVNEYTKQMVLHAAPKNREQISVNWEMGKWSFFVQEMRYGSIIYMASPTGAGSVPFKQNPGFITNLELDYKIMPRWTVGVGANNAGNKYPTHISRIIANTQQGLSKYASYSPYGFNGGMYYVKTSLDF
ncbi:TonB-dependent receptor plug domain-containing protein [Acetobacter conturbans]|uniref:TonB-dependent receptor plug domain-containing protein n=1 Tax=Acetobacter conturbans TaxID=1737472 RepID=A0ABX0K2A9_9PROT|nr:TonB-dependent receptor [Acetobacter conturbans]NHN89254.1 TonB-dependent receptor plug domain-containing protein [Acetobacter conturbans]